MKKQPKETVVKETKKEAPKETKVASKTTLAAAKKLNNLVKNKNRLKKLQSVLENFQHQDNKKNIEKYCEVLIENKLKNQDQYFGRTKYMTPVIFSTDKGKPGELINVKITSFNQKNLFGFHKINNVKAA